MTTIKNRIAGFGLAAVLGIGAAIAPAAASASEEGRRNTAIGLGVAAVALALVTQHHNSDNCYDGPEVRYNDYRYDVRRDRDDYNRDRDRGGDYRGSERNQRWSDHGTSHFQESGARHGHR